MFTWIQQSESKFVYFCHNVIFDDIFETYWQFLSTSLSDSKLASVLSISATEHKGKKCLMFFNVGFH